MRSKVDKNVELISEMEEEAEETFDEEIAELDLDD